MTTTEVRLVPLSASHLRVGEVLPFSIYDHKGQLLLATGQVIDSAQLLAELSQQQLQIDETESQDWRRRLVVSMDSMVRQNVALKDIATARPAEEQDAPRTRPDAPLSEQWEDCIAALDAALRGKQDDSWLMRVLDQAIIARRLTEKRPDASLYYQFWRASQVPYHYSAQHALFTQLVTRMAAPLLGMSPTHVDRLGEASLMMNVAMVRLQDELAAATLPPTPAQAAEIASHSQRGAEQLAAMGADEAVCRIVALHHTEHIPADIPEDIVLAAQVLRRVDIFTAKLSRRKSREPMSPVAVARTACLGADGRPDAIGAALLKALGLYPPGTFLNLANGELGVVIGRGRSPSHPKVASLLSSSGMPHLTPILRDTFDARFQVRQVVPVHQVRVRPNHAAVMALI